MKRLTWNKAKRDKFTAITGGFDGSPMSNEIYQKLAYYEDLEEQGRLVVLPCNYDDWGSAMWDFRVSKLDKKSFLSRESAEEALAGTQTEGNLKNDDNLDN